MSLEKIKKIQITGVAEEVKENAERVVSSMGFSSIQEFLRVILYQVGSKKLNVAIVPQGVNYKEVLPRGMAKEILDIEKRAEWSEAKTPTEFLDEIKKW